MVIEKVQGNPPFNCPICLDEIQASDQGENGKYTVLAEDQLDVVGSKICHHFFHKTCLKPEAPQNKGYEGQDCPTCRNTLFRKNIVVMNDFPSLYEEYLNGEVEKIEAPVDGEAFEMGEGQPSGFNFDDFQGLPSLSPIPVSIPRFHPPRDKEPTILERIFTVILFSALYYYFIHRHRSKTNPPPAKTPSEIPKLAGTS